MARVSFNAKDADGNTIKIAAQFDAINGIYTPSSVLPSEPRLDQLLSTNGDGTGTTNANGDFSAVSDDFYIEPGAAQVYHINKFSVIIETAAAFRAERYGAISALTTGVEILRKQATVETALTPLLIKNIGTWGLYATEEHGLTQGSGNNFIAFHWDLKDAGVDLALDGAVNDQFIVRLSDDFSAAGATLVSHYFLVQGHIIQ
ncbi:MAG: hypothetical protein KAJ19_26370 [Gammaproteobacteria bacterium]|nr:hypothetical protein [Gammaproteobacteria bacterium]